MKHANISAMNPVAYSFAIRARRSRLIAPGNDTKDVFNYVDFFNNAVRWGEKLIHSSA